MTVAYATPPRYPTLSSEQQPIVENGMITSWIMRLTMTLNGINHSVTERYECAEDEILPEATNEAGPLLEKILLKMDLERGMVRRCADELEEKVKNYSFNTGV